MIKTITLNGNCMFGGMWPKLSFLFSTLLLPFSFFYLSFMFHVRFPCLNYTNAVQWGLRNNMN